MNKVGTARIKPLDFSGQDYMAAHLNFRNNLTNQGQLMQDALFDAIKAHISAHNLTHIRLASIGSGTGIIDAPLVARLGELVDVYYFGIDPNIHEIKMAKQRFADHGVTDARFHNSIVEDFDTTSEAPFDVIIAVHVTYYSSDITAMLSAADAMLADNGVLLTIASENNPQNELFVETTMAIHGHMPTLATDYQNSVEDLGHEAQTSRIEARILMDDYLAEPNSAASWQFLDFFLHADSRSIPDDLIARYRATIEGETIATDEGMVLPHIAVLVASRRG